MSDDEFDFVLYDRARRGMVYHRPKAVHRGFEPACGARTMFQFDQIDETVGTDRYKAWRCGRCWR